MFCLAATREEATFSVIKCPRLVPFLSRSPSLVCSAPESAGETKSALRSAHLRSGGIGTVLCIRSALGHRKKENEKKRRSDDADDRVFMIGF